MKAATFAIAMCLTVSFGCAHGPRTAVHESASSFQSDESGRPIHQLSATALKNPFAEMGRSALVSAHRLSPKLKNPFAKRPRRIPRKARRAKRAAELPELAIKDPFATELKTPF